MKKESAFENTVVDLCDQIDYWKDKAMTYKKLYEDEIKERSLEANKRLQDAQEGVANALLFALSVKDDKDGNLIINKEDRKLLSKRYK